MEIINDNYIVHLEVLSPLHIGGATEKHLKKGLDYFYNNGLVYVIDEHKLLNMLLEKKEDISTYSNLLASDMYKLQSYLFDKLKIKYEDIAKKTMAITSIPNDEMKILGRNGFGTPYVAGSSIKGAIRSVLFHHLYKGGSNNDSRVDEQVFGRIDNNLMRFLRITDAVFLKEDSELLKTKILSRKGNRQTWKHKRVGSTEKFDDNSFTTTYECFARNSIASFRIGFASKAKELIDSFNSGSRDRNQQRLPRHINKIITKQPLTNLFNKINSYTKEHIRREIQFFELNSTRETEQVVEYLKELKEQILDDNDVCILRLASGSGFHGITGDWQYENHVKTLDSHENRYKTRRLAFERRNKNEFQFYPFGFVKLYSETAWIKHEKQVLENAKAVKVKREIEKNKIVAKKEQEQREDVKKQISAKKPTYFKGKLRSGINVDAKLKKVEGFNNKIKIFNLLIEREGKEQEVRLTYHASLDIGTFHEVKIANIQKTKKGIKVQSIQYIRRK